MGDALRVGFVGLGNIGGAVCANLVADGHEVTAFDVDTTRLAAMAALGARLGASVADVAAASEVTFLSLPTPAAMEAVAAEWIGAAPLGAGPLGSPILVDLTTNDPAVVRSVGARLEEAGARLLEAPVTGGAPGARSRRLVFIAGGDGALVEEMRPLLSTIGRATFHMGPLGCGNVGKLVNSLLAFAGMWVSIEGLALAAKNGIDLRAIVELVRASGAAASYLDRRVEDVNSRGWPAEFAIELAAKDAGLMVEVGRRCAVPVPVASALDQVLTYARAQGLGGRDIGELVEVMERAAAVSLHLPPAANP